MQYITRVTSKGQATIPVSIRRKLGVKSGHRVIFEEHNNTVSIRAVPDFFSLRGSLKTKIKWDEKKAKEAVGKMLAKRYEQKNTGH